jgi:hypothetical protein
MSTAQKIAGFVGITMVLTALFLPGRSQQESAVLNGVTNLSKGTIQAAEGR